MIRRISGLDDLAGILFPDNRRHRRVFVAVWVELKYATDQFLPSLSPLCEKYGFTERILETVRAKLRRLGILKRISHFSPSHTAGWVFSDRLAGALAKLAEEIKSGQRATGNATDECKDRDSIIYV